MVYMLDSDLTFTRSVENITLLDKVVMESQSHEDYERYFEEKLSHHLIWIFCNTFITCPRALP